MMMVVEKVVMLARIEPGRPLWQQFITNQENLNSIKQLDNIIYSIVLLRAFLRFWTGTQDADVADDSQILFEATLE